MKALKWTLAIGFLGLFSPVFAGQSGNISVSHYEPLQRINLRAQSSDVSQKSAGDVLTMLSFDAFGQSFEMNLEANSRFLSADARSALPAGVGIYRGNLSGNTNSWVRIVVHDGLPRGFVWDGKDLYAIEVPGDSLVATTLPVIYRLADTVIEPGSMMCGDEALSGKGSAVYTKIVGELDAVTSQAPGAVSVIDIGAVADFEFTSVAGDHAATVIEIVDRMNRVDGIFSQEIGVQISVPEIETFSDSNLDPFTESAPSLLLDQVAAYRQNTPAQNSLGLTHLWTGQNLVGDTVGIAFTDVLCRTNGGAGLSEASNSPGFDSLVAAHEIGHNFGAPHDGVPGDCESELQTFIMAPMLNGNNKFSQCSKSIMEANVALASCITALPTVDMSVALNSPPSTVLLGANTVLIYDVVNNGSSPAANASAEFLIPGNLRFDSVSTSIGSCAEGAGTIQCVLGSVPGLSNNTVTITTTPASVGAGLLSATVTADIDERPGNNQESLQLTVVPAVDLAVTSQSSITVAPDESSTITAVLENLAVLDASDATLSVTFGGRFRADSASWSIGSCTVAAQQIDCQANSFVNLSSSTLTVGITGLSTGQQDYIVAVSSNDADADPANNNATGTVTVADNVSADENGGGAAGVPFILLLGLLAFTTRRLSRRPGDTCSQTL
jgi:hypothetical protein